LSFTGGLVATKAVAALGIAIGSSLQALAARSLVKRYVGLPLNFDHARQLVRLLLLSSPLSCLIAPTIGVGALFLMDLMPMQKTLANWFTWWVGDAFGVIVFLPLMLVAPCGTNGISWRSKSVGTLPVIAMLALCVPLVLTLWGWKITSEITYRDGQSHFQSLAREHERALFRRLDSYNYALLGAAGLFRQGTMSISRQQWKLRGNTRPANKFSGHGRPWLD